MRQKGIDMNKFKKPVIGILLIAAPRFRDLRTGNGQFFYEKQEAVAEELCKRLDFAELIFTGVVYTRKELEEAMTVFDRERPDMIFASFLSWSDDFAWVRFLRDMAPIPILFASIVQPRQAIPGTVTEEYLVDFLAAGGLVGNLEGSGSIARFARPMMKQIIGTMDQIIEETRQFARAAVLRNELRQANFGLLASYNEGMWATYVDPYLLFMKMGPELKFLHVTELLAQIEGLSEEEVRTAAAAILDGYPNDGTVEMDKMYASVAASLGMEKLARAHNIEMIVLNDLDDALLRQVGLRPGFTPCSGTDDVMVVPEGDIGGALACYLLNKLSGQPVNFIEPFYIYHEDNTFAAGHAGPQNYKNPGSRTIISSDARLTNTAYKYAGAPFAWTVIGEGEKTMVHVSQAGESFKIAVSVVDALDCGHFVAGYSCGMIRTRMPVTEFFQKLLDFGVTQHYALVDGNWSREIVCFAELMGFACLELV